MHKKTVNIEKRSIFAIFTVFLCIQTPCVQAILVHENTCNVKIGIRR